MIRFSCRKCGKSLRASESIVGKKTKCTNCNAVNRVPAESTRGSGEKARLDSSKNLPHTQEDILEQEIVVTLMADQDSDEGFEDFDFSQLRIDPVPRDNAKPVQNVTSFSASSVLSAGANKRSSETPAAGDRKDIGLTAPSAALPYSAAGASRHRPKINWKLFGILGLITLAGLMIYGVSSFWKGRNTAIVKTPLELSPIGEKYAEALFELKKVERVMTSMENGFLQKKLPKSELKPVHETRSRFDAIVDDKDAMKEANQLFESGQKEAAEKMLLQRIEQMDVIRKDIKKQTDRLTARIYN